ncbi:ribonuclease H-like domain-containing protein [Tanacetum coccineum]
MAHSSGPGKEINLQELDKLQLELAVTLYLLEKFFPLSFFDIMIHLTVHLTREATQASFKNKNPGKQIALLENEHSKSFAKWLREEVERELAISKDSVSETVRWISYGPRATIVKYEAYNINGYTFRTKSNDGIVYQNSEVLDYRFRQIPLFKCDWVDHKAGRVKHDPNLGYTLVDLNSLGHKDDPFILAARQVFYVKDQIDKKLSIIFRTPTKNYKDTYDEVDEEFSTVIHEHNDNILPRVNRRDLGNESQNDYYRTDCEGLVDVENEFRKFSNNALAKLPMLKLGEYEMWEIRIKQYFQIQDYALWEVIENGNSWVPIPVTAPESDKDAWRNFDLGKMELENSQNNALAKLPMLKLGEYEMWEIRIKQYFQIQDYALWEVIENGNSWVPIPVTTPESGPSTSLKMTVPSTTEEKIYKKNDVKARSLLLMALPNEHQLTFNQYVDAQSMFVAIKARFRGNDATKKTQKALLKQQYENFNATSSESLDSIFNRLQKLVSRLAILGVDTSPEDLNVKFLRSLPSEWDTHVVVWMNKPDFETMGLDDLYNNFKIVEQKVKRTVAANNDDKNCSNYGVIGETQ